MSNTRDVPNTVKELKTDVWRIIFDEFWDICKCDRALCRVFDISPQSKLKSGSKSLKYFDPIWWVWENYISINMCYYSKGWFLFVCYLLLAIYILKTKIMGEQKCLWRQGYRNTKKVVLTFDRNSKGASHVHERDHQMGELNFSKSGTLEMSIREVVVHITFSNIKGLV